jgi:hypothetical protein
VPKLKKVRPKSEARPLAPKKSGKIVSHPDKKVSNRQISVRGVQKTQFSVPDGRCKCPNHPDKNPEKSENLSKLTLPKKKSWCARRKKVALISYAI